ncbi:MAG: peptidylprolyl isomerase [Rhodothermaceae bacterium]
MLNSFKFWFMLVVVSLISTCFAQDKIIPIVEIDDDVITLAEFEKEYIRSNGNKRADLKGYKEFLDVYTGFRLKLKDAIEKGYEEDPDLLKEYEDYKKRVSKTYYQTKFIKSPGLRKYYKQSQLEFRVAHILVKIDTTRNENVALELANSIIDSVNNGSDWVEMAARHSGDPKTAENGGDLYYYSGAKLGGEFLKSLLVTEIGKIASKPVRSRFGYHIIKVLDKKEGIPAVSAKHILIKGIDSTGVVNEEKAKKLCEELHQRVINGESFEELAKQYSDDKGSGSRGGALGFVPRGRTVRPFDEVLFNTKPGEVSKVFKTRFGYHFLTVVEYQEPPEFKEFVKQAGKTYDKAYFKQDYVAYIDSLLKHYQYQIVEENLEKIGNAFAKRRLNEITIDQEYSTFKDLIIMKYSDNKFAFENIVEKYSKDARFQNVLLTAGFLKRLVKTQFENDVIEAEIKLVEDNDKEFQNIMTEYKKGLLIFKLQETDIWKNVKIEEQDKKEYYEKNKDNFQWPKRLVVTGVSHQDKNILDSLVNVAKSKNGLSEEILKGFTNFEMKKDTILASAVKKIGRLLSNLNENEFSQPFKLKDGSWSVIYLEKKLAEIPKTYQESESEIASKILEHKNKIAEKEYIKGLIERYEPEYFYENLEQAFK